MASKRKKRTITGLQRHGKKWRWRRTIDGESVSVPFSAPTEAAAIAQVLEFEKHPHLFVAANWDRELEKHLEYAIDQRHITQTYADTRKRILTLAGKDMNIEHPRLLTNDKVVSWLDNVNERNNADTRNNYQSHINQFCLWLTTQNKIYINPCDGIPRARVNFTPRLSFLTSQEVRNVIDSAKLTGDKELELILLLACECGMRKGEIAAARPQWLNLEQGTINVPAVEKDGTWSRKGMIGRKKSVSIEMVNELRTYFTENGTQSPYLLRPDQPWGKWKYRYDFDRKVRNHLKSCGHPDITIHDLRRSFGSNRIIAGRSLEQVAHWMGIHQQTKRDPQIYVI